MGVTFYIRYMYVHILAPRRISINHKYLGEPYLHNSPMCCSLTYPHSAALWGVYHALTTPPGKQVLYFFVLITYLASCAVYASMQCTYPTDPRKVCPVISAGATCKYRCGGCASQSTPGPFHVTHIGHTPQPWACPGADLWRRNSSSRPTLVTSRSAHGWTGWTEENILALG